VAGGTLTATGAGLVEIAASNAATLRNVTIAAAGVVLGAANSSATLSGITLAGGGVTITASGATATESDGATILGFGTVDIAGFTNTGRIEASGGNLTFVLGVGGSGPLQIDANATLTLDGAVAASATASFSGAGGLLALGAPASFAASVASFAVDDAIELIGVTGDKSSLNGANQLVVTSNGATVATLQLAGANAGKIFKTAQSGGNTTISVLTSTPTAANFVLNKAAYDQNGIPVTVIDNGVNVGAAFDALSSDPVVASIRLASEGIAVVPITAAQFLNDGAGIAKISNSLFEILAGGVANYYANGAGPGGAPLTLAVSNVNVHTEPNAYLNLTGDDDIVTDGAGATLLVNGGGNVIHAADFDLLSLFSTNGHWDAVYESSATITMTNVQASLVGGGDVVTLKGTGDQLSLYDTGGNWDTVFASNATIIVNRALVSLVGGGDTVYLDSSVTNSISLYQTFGAWDTVFASNATVVVNQAQASIVGGGDRVYLDGASSDTASLYNTNNAWDTVYAINGEVILNNAQASLLGGGDTVYLDGSQSDALSLYRTDGAWDTIYGSHGQITLNASQASVVGGANTIYLDGSSLDSVSLYATGALADSVNGSNGSVALNSSSVNVSGSNDTVYFAGDDVAGLSGNNEQLVFGAALGLTSIAGFNSTDVIALASADFADWQALQPHIAASGVNDTKITLDANDVITLTGVAPSSLTAAQFRFG
jgi:hypothetical protein